MGRHVADRPRLKTGARARAFAEIAKAEAGARPQTLALQRREAAPRDDGRRASEYLRIDRGRTA